ncbi:DNA replication/repair protein RecF [Nakamurella lactea]|uniref:DNA replication/repair protein RecF n=1 Tax=Nakamurella lactea TaxID=459515 RepID=UPI000408E02B|nr:DNA replication/repair protein RecF [Nakamurella lactea]
MYVRHLSVGDFRSWETVEVPLQPGVNVLLGRNGVGKTNLVEAVGYLATLASHRVSSDQALIRRGAAQALVRAAVVSGGRELLLEVEITTGKTNRARINRSPVTRPRDILGALRTVLFAPEDLSLVRGDPSERRRFLDEVLVMRAPRLAGVRSDYDRILKQRNTLLKSAGIARRSGRAPELSTLDVWDEHLAEVGAELICERLALVDALRPHVVAGYAELAPESEPIDLVYRSRVLEPLDPDGAAPTTAVEPADPEVRGSDGGFDTRNGADNRTENREAVKGAMLGHLATRRSAELERGVSLVGPHRDELELRLADGLAKGYASHGESWSFALALRLGSFALLRSDGVDPVLVLDDVFAELDAGRRDQLAELVADAEQVLITAAVETDVPKVLGGNRLLIQNGTVTTDG